MAPIKTNFRKKCADDKHLTRNTGYETYLEIELMDAAATTIKRESMIIPRVEDNTLITTYVMYDIY
jgi:hypothetical protein